MSWFITIKAQTWRLIGGIYSADTLEGFGGFVIKDRSWHEVWREGSWHEGDKEIVIGWSEESFRGSAEVDEQRDWHVFAVKIRHNFLDLHDATIATSLRVVDRRIMSGHTSQAGREEANPGQAPSAERDRWWTHRDKMGHERAGHGSHEKVYYGRTMASVVMMAMLPLTARLRSMGHRSL
ncbi:hypothetical protein TKK_0005579 [Trichogramma kaykai]